MAKAYQIQLKPDKNSIIGAKATVELTGTSGNKLMFLVKSNLGRTMRVDLKQLARMVKG